jgi:His-Xaa-Ser system protein HxsD
MTKTLTLDPKLYPLSSVYSASYVFLGRAYLSLSGDPEKEITVSIEPKEGEDAEQIGKEFMNELINYLNYSQNIKENQDVVRLIVEKALFSASPALAEEAEEKEIQELIREFDQQDDEEVDKVLEQIKNKAE